MIQKEKDMEVTDNKNYDVHVVAKAANRKLSIRKALRKYEIQSFVAYLLCLIVLTSCTQNKDVSMKITNLKVEYTVSPIGIDVLEPRFSWQMEVEDEKRGYSQTAYQLIVTNEKEEIVWDSQKTANSTSLNILYGGNSLQPETRYKWNVTVWDQDEKTAKASSWFETGLMNPDPNLSAWEGATWIGGSDDDLVLYSPYLSVFKLQYKIRLDSESNSQKASFIYGANDSRLMDKNKNIFWVESKPDESYVKFELDISNVQSINNKGLALLNIYRVGYHPNDKVHEPFKTLSIPSYLINNENKYDHHQVFIEHRLEC